MKTVYLSAGHSTTDPGAVGNGLKEADVAVEVRNAVAGHLRAMGVTCEVDAEGAGNLPLKDAMKGARRHKIAVEFHCNAAANPAATGVETLQAPKDKGLGTALCAAIASALKIKNRGAKPENAGQHHRLGFVQAGGVIVELFFISNPADVKAYKDRKQALGLAIAEVLADAAIV
ncbi:MAG: N-acetylmuramoyl-L-alanine amidase [Pseudomonadota bacterium]